MAEEYIALTIGPIGDTLGLAVKPAALWCASYLFSYISKELCRCLSQDLDVGAENILCPYCSAEEGFFDRTDGLGLFPDHIIFRQKESYLETLRGYRNQVLEQTAQTFGVDRDYLEQYVMISACAFQGEAGENPILLCGKMLDSLELSKAFVPAERTNPLLRSFENKAVKETGQQRLGFSADWQLTWPDGNGGGRIRDIPHIAGAAGAEGFKKNQYYCLLRSDGDNMGKLLAQLNAQECRDFSRCCLEYGIDAARAVGDFGGVTIYVGGDDLFALLPCENGRGETVFDFIHKMNTEIFPRHFGQSASWGEALERINSQGYAPSLSFGVMICYEKYPLYEAVNESARLLFGVAKATEKKNCTAVLLQKHSGQSVELLLSHEEHGLDGVSALLREVIGSREAESSGESREQVLLSAWEKIALFRHLFQVMKGKGGEENLFRNIFDSDFHLENGAGFLHDRLPEFYRETCLTGKFRCTDESFGPADALSQALHMMKFFVEKGGED